jgi:hypothetical protein
LKWEKIPCIINFVGSLICDHSFVTIFPTEVVVPKAKNIFLAAMAALPLAIAGCGGGGSGGGIASAPTNGSGTPLQAATTQVASGVMTGFGSVYVDGVRLDDSDAGAVMEQADGSTRPVALQIGQRLRATHDGTGKISKLVVDAAVIGQVVSVDTVAGALQVAGQAVLVNTDASLGPLTQFGGDGADTTTRYSSLGDVQAGDLAEVHGSPVLTGGQWVVRATRIDKRAAIGAVRVSGVVSNLVNTDAAKTFQVGALTVDYAAALAAGKVKPLNRLATGVAVQVHGASTGVVGTVLTAAAVRMGADRDGLPVATRVQLGGLVSGRNLAAGTFQLDGALVRIGTVSPEPSGAVVNDGAWVKVAGTLAEDGAIDAAQITVRQTGSATDLARVRLTGPVTGLVDQNIFIVRDVPVDASNVLVASRAGCAQLVDGTLVSVSAVMQAGTDVVLADELKCEAPVAGRPVAGHAGGAVAAIDLTAKSLTITDPAGQTRTIRWTDSTVFAGQALAAGASALQAGMLVQAGGMIDGTALVAKVIGIHGSRPTDRFRERPPQALNQAPDRSEAVASWNDYQNRRRLPPGR